MIDTNKIKNSSLCIVKFSASWCGPCKKLAPVFEQVAKDYGQNFTEEQLSFISADVEEDFKLANSLNPPIRSVPTVVIFHNGNEVSRMTESITRENLIQTINSRKAD